MTLYGNDYFARPVLSPEEFDADSGDITVASTGAGWNLDLMEAQVFPAPIYPGQLFFTKWFGALNLEIDTNSEIKITLRTKHKVNGKEFIHERSHTKHYASSSLQSIPFNAFDTVSSVNIGMTAGSTTIEREDASSECEITYSINIKAFGPKSDTRKAVKIKYYKFENLDTISYQMGR